MEIKRFGNPNGKKIMLLHGNLMCWRQFEDVIPMLEEFDVYAVSFDGFDGTGKTTYMCCIPESAIVRCSKS